MIKRTSHDAIWSLHLTYHLIKHIVSRIAVKILHKTWNNSLPSYMNFTVFHCIHTINPLRLSVHIHQFKFWWWFSITICMAWPWLLCSSWTWPCLLGGSASCAALDFIIMPLIFPKRQLLSIGIKRPKWGRTVAASIMCFLLHHKQNKFYKIVVRLAMLHERVLGFQHPSNFHKTSVVFVKYEWSDGCMVIWV